MGKYVTYVNIKCHGKQLFFVKHANSMTSITTQMSTQMCVKKAMKEMVKSINSDSPCRRQAHTHTHNRFTALLDFVQDYPGGPAPER